MKLLLPLLAAASAATAQTLTIDIYNFTQFYDNLQLCNDQNFAYDVTKYRIMNDLVLTMEEAMCDDCDRPCPFRFPASCPLIIEGINDSVVIDFTGKAWMYIQNNEFSMKNIIVQGGRNIPDEFSYEGTGGAIYALYGNGISLENVVFRNNTAEQGGAAFFANNAYVKIVNCTFEDNVAQVSSSQVTDYKKGTAGAFFILSENATIAGSTFRNNQAVKRGGAILVKDDGCNGVGNLTISDSVFENNTQTEGPGSDWGQPEETANDIFWWKDVGTTDTWMNVDCASNPVIYTEYGYGPEYTGYSSYDSLSIKARIVFSKTCNTGAIDFNGLPVVLGPNNTDVSYSCSALPDAVCDCPMTPTVGTYQVPDCAYEMCINALPDKEYTSAYTFSSDSMPADCPTTDCVPILGTRFTPNNNAGDCAVQQCNATTGTYYTVGGDCVTTMNCDTALANETYTPYVSIENDCPTLPCFTPAIGTEFMTSNNAGDCAVSNCSDSNIGQYYTIGGDCETRMNCTNALFNEKYVAGIATTSDCPTSTCDPIDSGLKFVATSYDGSCATEACDVPEIGFQFVPGQGNGDCATESCGAVVGVYYTTAGDCSTTADCTNAAADEVYVSGVATTATGCQVAPKPADVIPVASAHMVGSSLLYVAAVVAGVMAVLPL